MSIDKELSTLVVQKENPLKQMLVEYVGNKYYEESDEGDFEVTVQMIVEALALEFPEFIMIMAEENWVRGYEQGIKDGTSILERTKSEA